MASLMPTKRQDVKEFVFGEEYMVHDEQAGKIHVLNQTASFIWNKCDGETSRLGVCHELQEAFNCTDMDQIQSDLEQTLSDLSEKGLLLQ